MNIFDKAKDALTGDKMEKISDTVLAKVKELGAKFLDAEKSAKLNELIDEIDSKIGNDEADSAN